MKHTYQASFTNVCRHTTNGHVCGRPEVDHGELAVCESCSYSGMCEVFPATNMLLCPACFSREEREPSFVAPIDNKRERVAILLNQLDKGIAMDSRAYFVSRVDSLAEIEMRLVAMGASESAAKLEAVEVVSGMLDKLQERIVSHVKELQEMRTYAIADQRYLTMMVPQLREAEREKYKKFDISYRPSPAVAAAKAVSTSITGKAEKKSASDKALESQAKLFGITVEQMRIINARSVATALGTNCTCAETPGICKIHPKS